MVGWSGLRYPALPLPHQLCEKQNCRISICPQIGGHHWDLPSPQVALGVTGVIEVGALVCSLQDPGVWGASASVVWVFLC